VNTYFIDRSVNTLYHNILTLSKKQIYVATMLSVCICDLPVQLLNKLTYFHKLLRNYTNRCNKMSQSLFLKINSDNMAEMRTFVLEGTLVSFIIVS
jgi:hypothetical protein